MAIKISNSTVIDDNKRFFPVSMAETKIALSGNDINLSLGTCFTKTITAPITLTVSNIPASGYTASFLLELTNGGSSVVTWWSGVDWGFGTPPQLTTSGKDLLGFITHDGGVNWTGMVLAKDAK